MILELVHDASGRAEGEVGQGARPCIQESQVAVLLPGGELEVARPRSTAAVASEGFSTPGILSLTAIALVE